MMRGAIEVTYIDGTSTIIVSDASWHANSETLRFQSHGIDFDDYACAVVPDHTGMLDSGTFCPSTRNQGWGNSTFLLRWPALLTASGTTLKPGFLKCGVSLFLICICNT